jgi:predicted HTH domain antitoxin
MIEVKFYLNNAKTDSTTIYAVVHKYGKKYKYPTGVNVETKYWNSAKDRCRLKSEYPEAQFINDQLDSWESIIKEIFEKFVIELITPSQDSFRKAVKNKLDDRTHQEPEKKITFLDFMKEFKESVSRSERTLMRYGTTINLIEKYQKEKKVKLDFSDIDMNFYESFKKWMYKSDLSLNYFGDMIKNIKTFMNEAEERKLHDSTGHRSKKFKTVSEESDTISLTVEKLMKIYNVEITEKSILELNEELIKEGVKTDIRSHNIQRRIQSLKDTRDRFMIGSFTALRYQDFNALNGLTHKSEYITRRNQKTGKLTSIPMHPVIKKILLSRGDILPPSISNSKMNKGLKILCRLAGLNELKEVSKTLGGKRVYKTFPEYQLVGSHTARRSACTNMVKAGIPISIIMVFSGHNKIAHFMKYIRIDAEEAALQMKEHPFFN